jgi:hypothetical protein
LERLGEQREKLGEPDGNMLRTRNKLGGEFLPFCPKKIVVKRIFYFKFPLLGEEIARKLIQCFFNYQKLLQWPTI